MKKIVYMIAVFIMVTVFFAAACVCVGAASNGTEAEAASSSDAAKTVCEHSFTGQKATVSYLKSEASCTTKAVYYYSCEYCGKAGTETFEYGIELGHTRGSEWITTVLYHWRECTVCHERIDTTFHRAGAEATETTPQTCAVCGYVIKKALGHTKHSFKIKNTDIKYLKSFANCQARAVYYYSCSCGQQGTETFEYGEKLDHSFKTEWSGGGGRHWHECSYCGEKIDTVEWKTDKPATVTETGLKREICTVCGYTRAAITIGKLPPSITYGNNCKWSKEDMLGLTFKSNAAYADFTKVLLDGRPISDENYYSYGNYGGNIVVILKASYLETLADGGHKLVIRSASGDATADFTIEAGTASSADAMDILTWVAVGIVVLGAGTAEIIVIVKKKKSKQ